MYKEITEERNHASYKWRISSVYFAFTGLALLAYFPLWSLLMAIKNDALVLSYPLFQFFSSQLKSGAIPWWHFNIHLGFPLHADPGFPFWSPITWLFALIGDTVYTFSFMLLFYVLLAGYGTIALLKRLGLTPTAQLTGAILYVTCGFFVSHLEHPHYIFEIAFIPFCLNFFFRLLHQPTIRDSVKLAISVFFLVNSGYPSFTISAVYFFFFLFILVICFDKQVRKPAHLRAVGLHFIIAITVSVMLCLPYLCSVIEFYPHFNRGGPLKEENTLTGGFTLPSFISLLFPLSSVVDRNFFSTEISWNNIYFGSIALGLSIYGITTVRHRVKFPLLIAGGILLLLSFQGLIKILFYKTIPLFDHIHTNGGLRVYFIVCMIVIAMLALDDIVANKNYRLLKRVLIILLITNGVSSILALLIGGQPHFGLSLVSSLKDLSIGNAIVLQGAFVIGLLLIAFAFVRRPKVLWVIIAAEAIAAFYINLPYTGLSINRTTTVQHHLDSIKKATSATELNRLISYPGKDKFFRDTALFSSSIAFLQPGSYPSGIKPYLDFVDKGGARTILNLPIVSCAHTLYDHVNHFRPTAIAAKGNAIAIKGTVAVDDVLMVTQNNYPAWNYRTSAGRGKPLSELGTFMTFPVKSGIVDAELRYNPSGVLYCLALSIFAWIFSCIILVKRRQDVYRNS